ncbi:hypothetical protein GCM10009578_039370 [Streptomyces rhizosphaericus]
MVGDLTVLGLGFLGHEGLSGLGYVSSFHPWMDGFVRGWNSVPHADSLDNPYYGPHS